VTQFSDECGAEMRELFFETAQELLQSLNEETLKLEKHPADVEAVRSIRRIVHTLKGDAAACGYRELSELAHELEDALALETLPSHTTLAEVAFAAADTFGAMLACYQRKVRLPSAEPLRKMIRELGEPPKIGERHKEVSGAPPAQAVWTEYEKLAIQNALAKGTGVYHITALVDPHCAMPIAARQLLLNALGGVGEVLGTRPENDSPKSGKQLELLVASDKPAAQVTAKCRIPSAIAQVSIEVLQGPAHQENGAAPEQKTGESKEKELRVSPGEAGGRVLAAWEGEEGAAKMSSGTAVAENILRVDAERIDNVLNLVGELIIGKSMLQQAFHEFAKHAPKEATRGRFADAMAFQARVLNDLQRSVMKIRMVPVEQLFRRFPRIVRDVAKQCDKEVELTISGEDTDLDKSLFDAIAEPLTHLVRNAVSHGIEPAVERGRCGKPTQGTIRLDAYHHGNQVIIEVSDDGRGIDAPRVKAKALAQGLLTKEEAARLSDAETLELVFRPGFTTAEQITEVSGRGVGLDVVQSILHRLKGTAEIETRSGQGTTFRMKLPLTLAIIKALLFRVEQRLYAIALNTVAEIARAQESDLHQVDNCEVLQLRNQVLPVVRLGRPPAEHQSGKIFVLVITLGERKLGLAVDALEGEEELVIKALDDHTIETDLVSGASILGDGRVVLIVNLSAIVERYAKSRPNRRGELTSGILLSHADRARIAQPAAEVRP
jgi:two-component system, chemotaxis family, sensor kinase CheA